MQCRRSRGSWQVRLISICALSLSLVVGCAPTLLVLGEAEPGQQAIASNASLVVRVDPKAPSAVHELVRQHLERGLEQLGYQLKGSAEADYAVLFDFGTKEGTIVRVTTRPITARSAYRVKRWSHYIQMTVMDARELRRSKSIHVIWRGYVSRGASRVKNPSSPEASLDRMLVALLEHFAENTDGTLSVRVSPNDPRMKALRGED